MPRPFPARRLAVRRIPRRPRGSSDSWSISSSSRHARRSAPIPDAWLFIMRRRIASSTFQSTFQTLASARTRRNDAVIPRKRIRFGRCRRALTLSWRENVGAAAHLADIAQRNWKMQTRRTMALRWCAALPMHQTMLEGRSGHGFGDLVQSPGHAADFREPCPASTHHLS